MEFDYVIAGGGSAGSVLAARLSEDPKVTVCLVEAGGEGRELMVRAPLGVAALVPGRLKALNWRFTTVPQPRLNGRRLYQPRGRGLGGSSAINAMLYTRGHPGDYDDWAAAGCEGWAWADVLPWFRRAEGNQRGGDALHGDDGPLKVRDQSSPKTVSRAFVEAAGQCQIRRNDDFNGKRQEGAGLYQVTQFFDGPRRGERCSAAAAYLHPAMSRPNLTVVTGAHATGLVLEGRRAVGLRYRRGGADVAVHARREIILSAGAFGSPLILMHSGIGPGAELSRNGVAVVHDLPGVGRNLHDHLDYVAAWRSRRTDLFGMGVRGAIDLARAMWRWRRTGGGLVATPLAEAGAFVRSEPGVKRPDLQMHFTIAKAIDHGRRLVPGYGFTGHVCLLRPFSRGEVGLSGPDPLAAPRIDPRYLDDSRDIALMTRAARLLRDVLAAPALAPWRDSEVEPPGDDGIGTLEDHVRARAETIYHPAGTCRMGIDDACVVDPWLRVRGIESLRVVDASIIPTPIGGNTNAPTIMIAEKAAEFVAKSA